MVDLILDAAIAVAACYDEKPEIRNLLRTRCEVGHRNWVYVAQQAEILGLLVVRARQDEVADPSQAARVALKTLQETCLWLAALAEDGDTLNDPDPGAASLGKAAARLGTDTRIVTDNPVRLERGVPFATVQSVCDDDATELTIPFIDLRAQQDRIRPGIERAIHRVLHHGAYINGPEIADLEGQLSDYVGVEHCVCVSSGTDALLIALLALEIGPGDEVITTPFSFIAPAEVITSIGATPVFVDVDLRTGNLDASLVETMVTDRTRAILPVSLYGQCANMTRINQVSAKHNLPVVEDAAQSFGALHHNKRSCGLSTIGCTSFFPAKPLGAYGDGGACFTADAKLAKVMRELLNHGQDRHYHHIRIGMNARMDSLQAAVLLEKLPVFDTELEGRQVVADHYSELLEELKQNTSLVLPYIEENNRSAWAQYTIQVDNRDWVRKKLLSVGIPSAVHYPVISSQQPAIKQEHVDCPNSVSLAQKVMSLPIHPYLDAETQRRIVNELGKGLH
jgi:UDP-2-acetamido-2-deoxy-ribo-hexuluronate aminotransferase